MYLTSSVDVVGLGFAVALSVVLVVISGADFRRMRIPNAWNGALLGLGLLACGVMRHHTVAWGIVSSLVGMVILGGIGQIYGSLRGRQGLGFGDVKFVAAAAAWIGLEFLPHMIMLSSIAGLCWVALARMRGRSVSRDHAIPFGPFLSIGLWITWVSQHFSL